MTSALITGANTGLGYETARRLGHLGWTIFLGSRDEGRGTVASQELVADGADVIMVPLDVSSEDSVSGAVRLIREHTDRLDVLVNNAATPGGGVHPADATAEDIQAVYDTNVYGPVRVTHAFLPLLRAAESPRVVMVTGPGGSIAFVTDPGQPVSTMYELAYTSSKAALNMITVRYAQALPDITFYGVIPGEMATGRFPATDMSRHMGELTVTEGSDPIVELATLASDRGTGTFVDRLGHLA